MQLFSRKNNVLKNVGPVHSDPLVTKLDFDKEPTPGPKHYPAPDSIQEPLGQDKMADKGEIQVQCSQDLCVRLLPAVQENPV